MITTEKELPLQEIAMNFVESRTERSFSTLYNRLKPGLRKFVQKYHTDTDTIEEILAITLSKAFIFVEKYDSRWNFSTWIYKICQNECLMEIRRKNTLTSLDNLVDSKTRIKAIRDDDWKVETEYELENKNEETIDAESLYDDVLEEIKNLPVHYKEIIEDRIVHKLKYKEIHEKRGIPINTVRSRIHSAKKVIRHMWIEKKRQSNSKIVNILGIAILKILDEDDGKNVKIEISANPQTLIIVSALYGMDDLKLDVTEKVRELIQAGKPVKSSNRLGGDPCYGKKKALYIEYNNDGQSAIVEIKEGSVFSA